MANTNCEDINFQHYIDLVKQNQLHWNIFIDFMQDLSYSDKGKLRKLNAILLAEMTLNYSDMDKLKYLNRIFLNEFKNFIQPDSENNENEQLEDLQESESTYETSKDVSTEIEIEIPIVDKIQDNLTSSIKEEIIECTRNENYSNIFYFEMSEKHENIQEIEPTVFNDEINNVLPTENEITNNAESTSSIKKELMKYNMNENDSKIFFCFICNKEYTIYFHLKQHEKGEKL